MKPTGYRAPSAARLISELRITPEQAETARALIAGKQITRDPAKFPRSNAHFNRCYHNPPRTVRILECLNEALGLHGVECIKNQSGEVIADYLNTGDTYAATLLFSHVSRAFSLTSWGDFAERNQTRYNIA